MSKMVGPSNSITGSIMRNLSPSRRRRDSFDSEDSDSLTERRGSGSSKRSKIRLPSLISRGKGIIDLHPDDDEEQFKLEWKLSYAEEVRIAKQ
jgi:hypothetical protein